MEQPIDFKTWCERYVNTWNSFQDRPQITVEWCMQDPTISILYHLNDNSQHPATNPEGSATLDNLLHRILDRAYAELEKKKV